jgi:hypothetical protein
LNVAVTIQSLGPFAPFALTRQYNVEPAGRLTVGVYDAVAVGIAAFTRVVVNEALTDTWMV